MTSLAAHPRSQDIAVVPFLVLLPLIEGGGTSLMTNESPISLIERLAPTAATTLLGLGTLLLSGRFVLREVFRWVLLGTIHCPMLPYDLHACSLNSKSR